MNSAPGSKPDEVAWIQGPPTEAELKLRLHAYVAPSEGDILSRAASHQPNPPEKRQDMAADLVAHCRGHTNLIFANSRNDVELFGDQCRALATIDGLPDEFLVHHGSLSVDQRQQTEETMKQSSQSGRPATTFCSSTLEMGIDIGNVHMVGQIGAPHSVASLKQRVGRSGRRADTPRILRAYLQCRRVDETSSLFDRLHLPLIQTIAVTELLLRNWVEPAETSSFDLSTLTQQIISLIAETGERNAKELYRVLCEDGAFRAVEPSLFAALLRQLGTADVIEQTPQGNLILGLVGEDLRKDKGFYAAFMTADAFAVLYDGQRIGSVDDAPEINQHMILGGRRWKVMDVDDRQMAIYVVPASGSKSAPFVGGSGVLHPRIVAEMREVLQSSASYVYLNPVAKKLLGDARQVAAAVKLCTQRIVPLDSNTTAFSTWVGTRTLDTVQAMFKARGIDTTAKCIAIIVPISIEACIDIVNDLAHDPPIESMVLDALRGPPAAKYDALLNPELQRESRKRRWLDLESARTCLRVPSA